MLAVAGVWEATGKSLNGSEFEGIIQWWVNHAGFVEARKNKMIVNIANEGGLASDNWYSKYKSTILRLRQAGIHTPLMIDVPDYANSVGLFFRHENGNANIDDCVALVNDDPDHNLIFSWHLYNPKDYQNGTVAKIDEWTARAISDNICLIFGEVGYTYWNFGWSDFGGNTPVNSDTTTNYKYVFQKAKSDQFGALAWCWNGWTLLSATIFPTQTGDS